MQSLAGFDHARDDREPGAVSPAARQGQVAGGTGRAASQKQHHSGSWRSQGFSVAAGATVRALSLCRQAIAPSNRTNAGLHLLNDAAECAAAPLSKATLPPGFAAWVYMSRIVQNAAGDSSPQSARSTSPQSARNEPATSSQAALPGSSRH